MDNIIALKLKALFRKLNIDIKKEISPRVVMSREDANDMIIRLLSSEAPCMIARYGATELAATINYLGVKEGKQSYFSYARGKSLAWWWYDSVRYSISNNAGFFPATDEYLSRFGQLMLEDSKYVDILGTSQEDEIYVQKYLRANVKYVRLSNFEPFWNKKPWTTVLRNKKVLVIYPLADTIMQQYKKRKLLFKNPDILPDFKSLNTIKAPQTLGKGSTQYESWFDALNDMEEKIKKIDFDICLIGCGAYGFPLAAFVKKIGKKAVHMGGSVQLLFGITGGRWDGSIREEDYVLDFKQLVNEHWVRPDIKDRPSNFEKVENSCYW